jgi:serine/threonine protein kinase
MIANKFRLIEKLGYGDFGCIYRAENMRTKEFVAVKIEPHENDTKLLKHETLVYQYLGNSEGLPKIMWFGKDEVNNYMVMQLLGDSLQTTKEKYKTLSLNVVSNMMLQMTQRLQYIHERGLLHRDVKPENFLRGLNDRRYTLYLIDFGFCKKFVNKEMTEHIEMCENKTIIGTPNYVSVNIHKGFEPSRRDDLESVAYIGLYLLNGSLPWEYVTKYGTSGNNNNEMMIFLKSNILKEERYHPIIREYIEHCQSLEFKQKPDYEHLIDICERHKK